MIALSQLGDSMSSKELSTLVMSLEVLEIEAKSGRLFETLEAVGLEREIIPPDAMDILVEDIAKIRAKLLKLRRYAKLESIVEEILGDEQD